MLKRLTKKTKNYLCLRSLLVLLVILGKIMSKLTNERKMLQKEQQRKEHLEYEISDRIKAISKTKEAIVEF